MGLAGRPAVLDTFVAEIWLRDMLDPGVLERFVCLFAVAIDARAVGRGVTTEGERRLLFLGLTCVLAVVRSGCLFL